jgi:hypothetical protein
VKLTWDKNPKQEQVIQYNVYFSLTKDGTYELLQSTAIDSFEHVTNTSEIGWYKITAVNHRGESEATEPFTVTDEQSMNENGGDNTEGGNDDLIDIPTLPGTGQ